MTCACCTRGRENAAAKARRYLGEGRVVITTVNTTEVEATVRGNGALYRTGWHAGTWSCTCPCPTSTCSHLRALRSVTAPDESEP